MVQKSMMIGLIDSMNLFNLGRLKMKIREISVFIIASKEQIKKLGRLMM